MCVYSLFFASVVADMAARTLDILLSSLSLIASGQWITGCRVVQWAMIKFNSCVHLYNLQLEYLYTSIVCRSLFVY